MIKKIIKYIYDIFYYTANVINVQFDVLKVYGIFF